MPLHETGTFHAEFVSIGFAEAETGTPYIFTKWNIETGAERTVYTYLSDASWDKAMQKLESIGFDGDFNNPSCTATETDLNCTHEEYDGKMRERWEFADWGSGGNHKEASKDLIRRMNAKWKKEHKGTSKGTTKVEDTSQTPRERAWEAFSNRKDMINLEQSELVEEWEQFLAKVIEGKEEREFNAVDWDTVRDAAKLPF